MKASSALAPALRDAARLVSRVAGGHSLSEQFAQLAEARGSAARAALLDLTHGTLRCYGRVQAIVAELSQRGPPDPALQALLWCSLYALDSGRYAPYTAVDQAVKACALLERWSAKGYVNALLRRYLRDRSAIEHRVAGDPQALYQHPGWWIEILSASYPQQWETTLRQGNVPPPMCLRVNARRSTVEQYAARLASAGIGARALGGAALLLERAVPVQRLPGFEDGLVSVQDAGAQRAAYCLDLRDRQRVLDACAAPGGKTGHILEMAEVDLIALDIDPERTGRLARNLARLGFEARVEVADAVDFATAGVAGFDRILADVPCSGSGVVRRHPDIKWLRRQADLAAFAERQARLLDALWRLLLPGGKLLYATCSVFPQENDGVVDAFVARSANARRSPLVDGGPAQWLPSAEHDGFYYALIEKSA